MTLSEAVSEVIRLADRIREYWDIELPKRHPNYPIINAAESSGPPPPEEGQLRKLLASLPADMIYRLILLMYLGRGDFDTSDLAGDLQRTRDTFDKPEYAISQMMTKVPLGEYLSDGMELLRKDGIDVDDMLAHPAEP